MNPTNQQLPTPPIPGQPLPATPAPKPQPRLKTKPLIITGVITVAVLVLGTDATLLLPGKKPVPPVPEPTLSQEYYFLDQPKGEAGKKGSFTANVIYVDPATGKHAKSQLATDWGLIRQFGRALLFSADGSRYLYATTDRANQL